MNNNKEQHGRDIVCRTHSARSERDLYRVCPSKLSKSELEDLYFALLENNLELKRTINGQREKIKTLSTKVQRMSATQKGNFSRESRECCLTTKAIVNEQKDTIAELKKANERMSERIRLLDMRLCSAKQFMKRSPVQSTTRCIKCSSNPPANSPKNSSTIGLNTNTSETNLKTAAVSCHELAEKDIPSTRSVHTEIDKEQEKDLEQPCSENKCRTLMEELKQKIVNLQEELSTAHSEYSSRIGRLETEVSSLQTRELDTQEISSRLTRAEVRNGELAMELSIEKGKVAELETNMKAAQMSSKVAATIEGHLANIKMAKHEYASRTHPLCSPCCPAVWEDTSPRLQIPQSTPSKVVSIVDVKSNLYDKQTKNADDSGYTETNRSTEIADDKAMKQLNQELMNKIVDMQTQLDRLKVTAVSDTTVKIKEPSTETKVTYKLDEPISMYVKDKGCIIIEAEKEISPEPTVENSAVVQEITVESQPTPNAQDLTAPSSTNMPAKYPLLWIGDGQKNTEDTDEGSYTIQPSDKPPQIEYKPELVPTTKDDHNKYQIPGPIAVDNRTRRRSSVARCSKSKESHQSIDSSIIKVGDKVDNENKTTTIRKLSLQEDKISPDHKDEHDIDNLSVKIDESKLRKDSVEVMKERIVRQLSKVDETKLSTVGEKTPQEHNSLLNYYVDPLKSSRLLSVEKTTEKKDEPLGTQVDYLAAVESCPPYAEAAAMEQPRTYTIQIEGRDSRSTDTDHEISAMTDLPTEKDDKSAADTLSPGEDKATSTHSRSYSPPTTDYGTLSEGELPTVGPARKLSVGERPAADAPVLSRKSSQQKMEEALLAITEELARCKELLLKQRQKEVKYFSFT